MESPIRTLTTKEAVPINAFDFLRKLYISTQSAVVITNSISTIFWSKNLDKLGITEEDLTGDNVYKYFDCRISRLYPDEGIVDIDGSQYHYSVKTISEKGNNDFIILEIITEPLSNTYINDVAISTHIHETQDLIEDGTAEILALFEKPQNKLGDDQQEYLEDAIKKVLSGNLSVLSAVEMSDDFMLEDKQVNSLSHLLADYGENCQAVFKNTDIKFELSCVEDIGCKFGKTAFHNLCTAVLSRAICSSRGYIDKVVFSLELLYTGVAELSVEVVSETGKCRLPDTDVLEKRRNKGKNIGSDLFNIRYYCREVRGGATERVDRNNNTVRVTVRVPSCEAQGVLLFTLKNQGNVKNLTNEVYDRYGNFTLYARTEIALSYILRYLENRENE